MIITVLAIVAKNNSRSNFDSSSFIKILDFGHFWTTYSLSVDKMYDKYITCHGDHQSNRKMHEKSHTSNYGCLILKNSNPEITHKGISKQFQHLIDLLHMLSCSLMASDCSK